MLVIVPGTSPTVQAKRQSALALAFIRRHKSLWWPKWVFKISRVFYCRLVQVVLDGLPEPQPIGRTTQLRS